MQITELLGGTSRESRGGVSGVMEIHSRAGVPEALEGDGGYGPFVAAAADDAVAACHDITQVTAP